MRMFILSVNSTECPNISMGYGQREFDHGHMLMWLCQMVFDEVILGVQIDWSTVPHTNADLRATCHRRVLPSFMLGQNVGRSITLVWQPPTCAWFPWFTCLNILLH